MFNAKRIEHLLVLCLMLGTFQLYTPFKVTRYILCLILQLISLLKISKYSNINSIPFYSSLHRYVLILLFNVSVFISFFLIGAKSDDIVNRVLPLISMYGIIIFLDDRIGLDRERILRLFSYSYVILALVVNIDACAYIFTGVSLWPPMIYVSDRFSGPFEDPNFMALFSASIFFVFYTIEKDLIRWRRLSLGILFVNILLAGSFSTLAFIPFTIFLYRYTKRLTNLKKQIIILVGYFAFISFYAALNKQIEKSVVEVLYNIIGSYEFAEIKYGSLQIRLDTQSAAVSKFCSEWWGQGPLQLVPQLEHDAHNSYVSMMFEQGIFGLLMILCTLNNKRPSKIESRMGTYLMLSALLLNVHDCSIYSLFVLTQHTKLRGFLKVYRGGYTKAGITNGMDKCREDLHVFPGCSQVDTEKPRDQKNLHSDQTKSI